MTVRRFRPNVWGALAAAGGVAATIALGVWQTGRAQEKLALAAVREQLAREPAVRIGDATVDPERIEHRKVEARGRFVAEGMVLLDNRVRRGTPGYEVVMPLVLAGGRTHVLINRGWIAGKRDRRELPAVTTPTGEINVVGRATVPGRRLYELSADTIAGTVWQNLTIERYRKEMKLPIQGIVIEQTSDLDDGLLRTWPAPDRGVDTHRSYAFQWFALAVLIVVLFLALSFRRVSAND